jgi:outer membrane protein TolC
MRWAASWVSVTGLLLAAALRCSADGSTPTGLTSAHAGTSQTPSEVAAAAPAGPTSSPTEVSLEEAIRLAHERSPLAQEADARVRGAEARLKGASALENPTLGLAHWVGKNTGGLDEDVVLAQVIESGGKRGPRVRAARSDRDVSLADRAAAMLALTYETESAYYEALRAEAERQLALDDLKVAQAFAEAAQTQFAAGDVARNQVLRSQTEVATAQQALDSADVERTNRYAELRSLLGLRDDVPLTLTDTLEVTPRTYELPALLSLGMTQRPDLQAERWSEASLAADVQAARAQSQPDLFWEARREKLDPTCGGSSLRVGVVFPIADLGSKRADVRAARAAQDEQAAKVDEAVRVARLEIESAFRALELAGREVRSFQAGRLARADKLLSMAQLGYDRGALSYPELLDAQNVHQTERASYARALAAYHIARASLGRAVGGRLP